MTLIVRVVRGTGRGADWAREVLANHHWDMDKPVFMFLHAKRIGIERSCDRYSLSLLTWDPCIV